MTLTASPSLTTRMRAMYYRSRLATRRLRVVSYPNSGRTYLRSILSSLDLPVRFTHVGSRAKSHFNAQSVCSGMERYENYSIIFMVRDPLDTLVSTYFQATTKMKVWQGEISQFIRHEEYGMEKVIAFHQGWIANAGSFKDFHLLSFEQLKADPVPHVRKVLDIIGIGEFSDAQIADAVEQNSFEQMRKRELAGKLFRPGDRFHGIKPDEAKPDALKTRRGKVGGYVDYFSRQDIAWCNKIAKKHGYDYRALSGTHPQD